MNDKIYTVEEIRAIVQPILEKHHIGRAYLFGSYARGEAGKESDIDLRVDMAGVKGLDFYVLQDELSAALEKKVDLLHTEHLRSQLGDPWIQHFVRNMKKSEGLLFAGS